MPPDWLAGKNASDKPPYQGPVCFAILARKTIFPVDRSRRLYQKAASRCGAVAQLGERLNGIQEVVSSILSSSTT